LYDKVGKSIIKIGHLVRIFIIKKKETKKSSQAKPNGEADGVKPKNMKI
jgi:hypothetical protein